MTIDLHFSYQKKQAVKKSHPYAKIEAAMLHDISKIIPTPEVYESDQSTLIMQYIPNNTQMNEIKAAKTIAKLHQQTNNFYGYHYDTTIGPFLQPNGIYYDWIEFYSQKRVFYMAQEAYNDGCFDNSIMKQIEKLCQKFETLLPKHPTASLIHGDIWNGNVLNYNNTIYLIDPALYYAHHEVELAFIMMFQTFSKKFFDAYHEIISIEKEFFEYRFELYQVYSLLVHIRIYGASYLRDLEIILKKFL